MHYRTGAFGTELLISTHIQFTKLGLLRFFFSQSREGEGGGGGGGAEGHCSGAE